MLISGEWKESIIIWYSLRKRLQRTQSFLLWVNLAIISVLGVRMFEDRIKAAGGLAKCEKREAVWACSVPPPPCFSSLLLAQATAKSYFQTQCCGPILLASVSMQALPYCPLNYVHVSVFGDFFKIIQYMHFKWVCVTLKTIVVHGCLEATCILHSHSACSDCIA